MKVSATKLKARGVLIVRDANGIARFDNWHGLPDETQRNFRRYLTEYEREIYPLRNPVNIGLIRGHNGFPHVPIWADLDLDVQEALRAQMSEEEKAHFPLREAVKWVHPTNPELPRKRTKADAYS